MRGFALFLFLSLSLYAQVPEVKVVKVAGLFDLSGKERDQGGEFAEAFMDYIRYVNEKEPIYGIKLELVWDDYNGRDPLAILGFRKLIPQKPRMFVGWGEGVQLLSFIFTKKKIPFVITHGTYSIADPQRYPYTFLVGLPPEDQVKIVVLWIKSSYKKVKSIEVVYQDDPYGKAVVCDEVRGFFRTQGIKPIFVRFSKENIGETLGLIRSFKTPFVLIHASQRVSIPLIKAIYDDNLKKRLFLTSWAFDRRIVAYLGDASENLVGVVPFALWEEEDIKGIQLVRRISRLYHPTVEERSYRYTQGVVVGMVLKKAMERAGRILEGKYLKGALETFVDYKAQGLVGGITLTRDSHLGLHSAKLYMIRGGRLVPVSPMIYTE